MARLHEAAEALGVGGIRKWWTRSEPVAAVAMTALPRSLGPHGPVASADTKLEILGYQISQNEFRLHAASAAVLRKKGDWHAEQMAVEPAVLGIRQVGDIAADPEAIPYRSDRRDADTE